ncbi:TIGR03857 family LLM class F420-dependent oxidoreductase [Rhodococcus pyridinivorans]|uniref:TIGR03857 family LLM class F420-dependent oxidoreductase n=1 Tax=Rhodococcus pyridinivorans TaxID=103816 RepID=UPI002284D159|nr:TIGR03857 family LLM class F420-dependent oxidoreductase [Rhodococcus pyridinivorans]WAL49321.1 TIGR03857 family LLM class F420-dependent oxidoreductase [Rhodococcus pyridinivorans]
MSELSSAPRLDQLGFYTLGGHVESPRQMLTELAQAEELGLGQAFLSERLNVKEACALSGAAGASTESIGITTAATNHNTRHPAITAAFATTMHKLTGGRFTLGLGRGLRPQLAGMGLAPVTTAQLEEFAALMRRLWKGETVRDYAGLLGTFPKIALNEDFDEDIPIGITAFGPATLALAGRSFDVVVLHTFFSDDTVRRCVEAVRVAAEQAGRDPAAVKIWSCYATVTTDLDEQTVLLKTVGRMATYLQVYGDLLVKTNNWSAADLERFRNAEVVCNLTRWADELRDVTVLHQLREAIPQEWLDCAAVGSAAECAQKVRNQFDLGVDGVIMHGATPGELAPIVHSYRDQFLRTALLQPEELTR